MAQDLPAHGAARAVRGARADHHQRQGGRRGRRDVRPHGAQHRGRQPHGDGGHLEVHRAAGPGQGQRPGRRRQEPRQAGHPGRGLRQPVGRRGDGGRLPVADGRVTLGAAERPGQPGQRPAHGGAGQRHGAQERPADHAGLLAAQREDRRVASPRSRAGRGRAPGGCCAGAGRGGASASQSSPWRGGREKRGRATRRDEACGVTPRSRTLRGTALGALAVSSGIPKRDQRLALKSPHGT